MNSKEKKKRVLYVLQIVLFLALLGAGAGAIIFGVCEGKTYSELEKRELKKFPEVSVQSIFDGSFESELTDALSDHIWGRDGFVTAKTRAEVLLGKREIDGIYIDGDRLIETYKDGDFDDKQIRENEAYVAEFLSGIAGNIGAEHVRVALVPSKCSLYRDRMPSYMPQSRRSDTIAEELREKLAEELPKAAAELESDEEDTDADEDTEDVSQDGFSFDEGDADKDADDLGFDFDEGDPDAEKEEKDLGFDFDEGDPSKEEGSKDSETNDSINTEKKTPSEDSSETEKSADESISVDSSEKSKNNSGYAGLTDEKKQKKAKEDADRMVINLRSVLEPHADEYIYYLTDHHWTSLGARYAYQELQKALGFDDKNKTESEIVMADDFLGTDYNRIHYYQKPDVIHKYDIPEANNATMEINNSGEKTKYQSIYDEKALKTADKYNWFFSGNYSAITVDTEAKNDKTLLLIKDSFSNSLVPFLCQDYKTIIMVDLRYVNSSVTDYLPEGKVPDDVLVVYNEEKFMQDTHQMYLS